MKRITLLRHAKSSWSDAGITDHDRPLNQRGNDDAPMMGKRLLNKNMRPSLIVTSTAKRARQTARHIATAIGYPIEFLQSESRLYLADSETLLEVIGWQDERFNDIVICAHNPGISELAIQLSGQPIDHMPTCGMVIIESESDNWSELGSSLCRFVEFDYPKKSPATD